MYKIEVTTRFKQSLKKVKKNRYRHDSLNQCY